MWSGLDLDGWDTRDMARAMRWPVDVVGGGHGACDQGVQVLRDVNLTDAALAFGGMNAHSGAATSRTLMLAELSALLAGTPAGAVKDAYKAAVIDDNVLLKPSAGTRAKTYAYLRDRFALDPDVPVFGLLRLLWNRDPSGRPLVAVLVASSRDPLLRATFPALIAYEPDQPVSSRSLGQAIENAVPGRFNDKTIKATGARVVSTYKQSGHLRGRSKVYRQRVTPTPGSVTVALLFAALGGAGGLALLDSDWVRVLDSPGERVLAEARIAASRGWLEIRQAGDVLDISFDRLLASLGGPR